MEKVEKNVHVKGAVAPDTQFGMSKLPLLNKKIGISISESESYSREGFSRLRHNDITGELFKYLIINGAHVYYGGDLREGGYTFTFAELAFHHNPYPQNLTNRFSNYLAWPLHLDMDKDKDKELRERLRHTQVIKCTAPRGLPVKNRSSFINDKYYRAKALSKMREELVAICEARLCVGGKLTDYSGFYPGTIEEAFLALKRKQPLYLSGAFAGATSLLVRAVRGEDEEKLTYEMYDWYPHLHELHYEHKVRTGSRLQPEELFRAFRKAGIKGLARANKLTEKENEVLFDSLHFHEILYHHLIGLKRAL